MPFRSYPVSAAASRQIMSHWLLWGRLQDDTILTKGPSAQASWNSVHQPILRMPRNSVT